MEKSRKNLKINSILVLVWSAVSLVQVISHLIKVDMSQLPEGTTEDLFLVSKIITIVLSVLFLLPQFYIGFKGLRIAKNPTKSRTHIKWAIVLLVITAICILIPITEIIKGNSIPSNISMLCDIVIEGIIYVEYIKFARLVAEKAN